MRTSLHPRYESNFSESLLIVAVISLIFGFVVMAILKACQADRKPQCMNPLRQLGLSVLGLNPSTNHFRYVEAFFADATTHHGDPAKASIVPSIIPLEEFARRPVPWLRG